MYDLHVYDSKDGYRWGLVADNGEKLGDGEQGYSNLTDMETVLDKLFLPVKGAFMGVQVPWRDCKAHKSKHGQCYIHELVEAKNVILARAFAELPLVPEQDGSEPEGPTVQG